MKSKFERYFDIGFTTVVLTLTAFIGLVAYNVYGQTNVIGTNAPPAPGGTVAGGISWTNLAYIIPFAAPILVLLLKKGVGLAEKNLNPVLTPYICVVIAIVIAAILDWTGHLTISPWLWGPIAGALGVGMRELLSKGLSILGMGTPPPDVTPGPTPDAPPRLALLVPKK